MKYSLDTNAVIQFLNGTAPGIRDRILEENPSQIVICSVVRFELFYGALRSGRPESNLASVRQLSRFGNVAFDDRAAEMAGQIRADLARTGTPIGPYDLLIAATALANNMTLISNNTREFQRVAGLLLEDWQGV